MYGRPKDCRRKKKIVSVPTILLYEIDPQKGKPAETVVPGFENKSETGKKSVPGNSCRFMRNGTSSRRVVQWF